MEAEIVAIGTELLLGVTVDTNSAYLAQQLATVGVAVRRVTLVRDDLHEIVGVLRQAMDRSELVVCSGGLGPTGDDLTREAIAEATGRPLVFHQMLLDDIAARFAAFQRTMSESNRRQAYVPQDAFIIRNPRGTAPAFVAERAGRYVAALPGVPQELHYLTEHALLPYLREQHNLAEVLVVREVRVSGLTEAEAGERIADIMLGDNPVVGITAKRGQHTIRIAAQGPSKAAAEALITPLVATINERFVGFLMGEETLEQRVGRLLAERGIKLELVETEIAAPVYRALTQTTAGAQALAQVTIRPSQTNPESASREYAQALATAGNREPATARLAVVAEAGGEPIRNVHVALAAPNETPRYDTRGIDFGLAQAHDFVASTALELLRRWLEPMPSTTAEQH
ncbi:MAG: competence/damage-inducible protein A [Chloroflexi bacterium]|nr:MAG: competence/damage-inducible protein A [Chloroflexota bacterium]